MSNDTWSTGLNNNDLIIGPSGAGKTRNYVKPNLMQCNESVIVADTKNNLLHEVGPLLKKQGMRIINVDFTDMMGSYGYNPLDYIRSDPRYYEKDIISIAAILVPIEDPRQPIWEYHARDLLCAIIAYVMECLPPEEHTLEYVVKLFNELYTGIFDQLFQTLGEENPSSFAVARYKLIKDTRNAEKMFESIRSILAEKLSLLTFNGPLQMYSRPNRVDFASLGREKTAIFLNVDDMDHSVDRLVALFYAQALQALCYSAKVDYPDQRLPVPVRLILDDFAASAKIPDFDSITSVIRSREISVSIILQSISQLDSIYGRAEARTIINNCDNWLYLGGQDVDTAQVISCRAGKTVDTILALPLNETYLLTRGNQARRVKMFDICTHERYHELPEAAQVQVL